MPDNQQADWTLEDYEAKFQEWMSRIGEFGGMYFMPEEPIK